MSDMTYFRIGVPNDMVADIMWNDDFEVSIESYSKHETNYQRYFGTPGKAADSVSRLVDMYDEEFKGNFDYRSPFTDNFRTDGDCEFIDSFSDVPNGDGFGASGITEEGAIEAWNTRHERTCQIEGTYSDEFAIYDYLTCGHVNLRHWHEPTSYCSTCGARVKEDADADN